MQQGGQPVDKHPSPFGQWLRQARISAQLSQAALGKRAQLHRLQIAYLETGRTSLPRSDARSRLYAALGQHPPQSTVTDSTRVGVKSQPCSFCGTDGDATWFMATSALKPGICMCAYCLMAANQQANVAAREQARQTSDDSTTLPTEAVVSTLQ